MQGLPVSHKRIFTPKTVAGLDTIDDEDECPPAADLTRQSEIDINSNLVDDEFDVCTTNRSTDREFETPLPKRRRLSGARKSSKEPIVLSSSPTGSQAAEGYAEEAVDNYSDLDTDDNSPSKSIVTPRRTSRFVTRTAAPPQLDSREQKPVFRPPDHPSHLATEITSVLPEAFTPSRKKGKNDYIPGGLADTIRNMVLGIATEAAQRGGLDEKIISIESATLDSCSRAVLAIDRDGVQWVLAGDQDRSRSDGLAEKLTRLKTSGKIAVLGKATQWSLPFDHASNAGNVRFAAHWNVH